LFKISTAITEHVNIATEAANQFLAHQSDQIEVTMIQAFIEFINLDGFESHANWANPSFIEMCKQCALSEAGTQFVQIVAKVCEPEIIINGLKEATKKFTASSEAGISYVLAKLEVLIEVRPELKDQMLIASGISLNKFNTLKADYQQIYQNVFAD